MSRSYRHNNFATIRRKSDKIFANRKVRRSDGIFNYGSYRKVYESSFLGYSNYYVDDKNKRK